MASEKIAVASGADFDQATRRRNVPSTSPNSGLVDKVEVDDKKTRVKKVSCCICCRPGVSPRHMHLRKIANLSISTRMSSHYFNSSTNGSLLSRPLSLQHLPSSRDCTRLACPPS